MEGDKLSIRSKYEELGHQEYYSQEGSHYENPHELIIKEHLLSFMNLNYQNKDIKILDLCSGSGEVSRTLLSMGYKNIKGLDPYTYELYKEKTQLDCYEYSFKDILVGRLTDQFDLIVCSFALHLAEESMLPNILYNLSNVSKDLIILTPHKKPSINQYYSLEDERYKSKVRLRWYKAR